MNDEEMNYERAKVFFEKQIVVHVSKTNGIFYNGLITEVQPSFIFIDDKEDGSKMVLFKELAKDLEESKNE